MISPPRKDAVSKVHGYDFHPLMPESYRHAHRHYQCLGYGYLSFSSSCICLKGIYLYSPTAPTVSVAPFSTTRTVWLMLCPELVPRLPLVNSSRAGCRSNKGKRKKNSCIARPRGKFSLSHLTCRETAEKSAWKILWCPLPAPLQISLRSEYMHR